MSKSSVLKLGTRGSPLALWQASWTRSELEARNSNLKIEILRISTTGDRIRDVPLAAVGGKGLFTKELDEALLDRRIDFAVHSLKDLPSSLPDGIVLNSVSRREDPRDALVSDGRRLREMPPGARLGTSSLRRQAQLRRAFPALEIVSLRGNVDTRLRKLDAGEFDGIVLAAAGLKRLGHTDRISEYLERDVMLSAIGQGALGIVCREEDTGTQARLRVLDDSASRDAVFAERAFLARLEGSCQVPIAGYAEVHQDSIALEGLIASLDGKRVISDSIHGARSDAAGVGFQLGDRLRAAGAESILDEIRRYGP
jgi:hydroxymethylbilane synthase